MFRRHESYRKASCLFLATLQLHLCSSGQFTQDGSNGYISFWETGKRRVLSFREIEKAHYLPPSNRHGLDVDKNEVKALWRTIASREFRSSDAKSTQIRNPSIRYLHKSLANVLFPRFATNKVITNELNMIDVALTGILPTLDNGKRLQGSATNGGITRVMIDQLLSYQSWALLNESSRQQCELRMGGLITPLLFAVGFAPDMNEDIAPPEEIDINYLKNCQFLRKTPEGGDLIYQFIHPQFGNARILLPNPGCTSLRGGANVAFNPPQSFLLNHQSAARTRLTDREHPTPMTTQHRGEHSPAEDTEMLYDFDHFHFEEFAVPRTQSAGLKAAHEHINKLQRWNKSQDKLANKLVHKFKTKIKKLTDQVKALQNMMSCTTPTGVQRGAAPIPTPAFEFSEDDPDHTDHDATGVTQPPPRQPPPDPPRHSSFEPRQRKRRTREHHAAGSTEAHTDTDMPLRRCTTTARPAGLAGNTMPQPDTPADLYAPQPPARAGPSVIPPYTQESMDAEIDALLRGHR